MNGDFFTICKVWLSKVDELIDKLKLRSFSSQLRSLIRVLGYCEHGQEKGKFLPAPATNQDRFPAILAALAVKEGAYYCYCAYILRISRYSDFLWVVLINTGIFLRRSKLCGESRT